jgi:hypothetical protein
MANFSFLIRWREAVRFSTHLGMALIMQCAYLGAQTRIDAQRQSWRVNFGNQSLTVPARLVSILPQSCEIGEQVFLRTAPSGQNLYGCSSGNTWALMSGDGGSTGPQNFSALRNSATTFTIGNECSLAKPCTFRAGGVLREITGPASVSLQSAPAAGNLFIYLTAEGNLELGHSPNLSVSCGGCTVQSGLTGFPENSIPLYRWAAGTPAGELASEPIDLRSSFEEDFVEAGFGLTSALSVSGARRLSVLPGVLLGTQNGISSSSQPDGRILLKAEPGQIAGAGYGLTETSGNQGKILLHVAPAAVVAAGMGLSSTADVNGKVTLEAVPGQLVEAGYGLNQGAGQEGRLRLQATPSDIAAAGYGVTQSADGNGKLTFSVDPASVVTAGNGLLQAVGPNGRLTLSADPAIAALRRGVPANATSACSTGEFAVSNDYYYACVSNNVWRRVAISAW